MGTWQIRIRTLPSLYLFGFAVVYTVFAVIAFGSTKAVARSFMHVVAPRCWPFPYVVVVVVVEILMAFPGV
jgi:hypothetical protein